MLFLFGEKFKSGHYSKGVWWLFLRVHVSWLIALASAAFVAGVVFAPSVPGFPVGLAAAAGLLVVGGFIGTRLLSIALVCVGGCVLGLSFGAWQLGGYEPYKELYGRYGTLSASVREDPSVTASGSLALQLHKVMVGEVVLPGAVLATVDANVDVLRGDKVTLYGLFEEPLGAYRATMGRAGVVTIERPYPGDVGRRVRDWFAEKVRLHIRDPPASLGIGFLTGQKSALPREVADALRVAGLTHIVVASGYNLTILVRLSRRLFVRVSKYLSAFASFLMVASFMLVTGLSPSMARAGLVSSLSLLTWYYGRAFHPLVLLPVSAIVTVLYQPSYAWGDLGWQLSFAAFAGVMVLAPLLQRYFFGAKEPGTVRQILGETLAAHLVTLPIIALGFGTVSNVAIIANLLVVPFVPLAMLLTFLTGLWSISGLPGVWLLATPTEWLLSYMLEVAAFLSSQSWAQAEVVLSSWGWLAYYGLLIGGCLWMWRATKYNLREANTVI